jgi:hypothetical protein
MGGEILQAQTVPDSMYYERLYFTCKVWGYVKYFHSEIARGKTNWGIKLIETLVEFMPKILNAYNEMSFHLTTVHLTTRLNDSHTILYMLPIFYTYNIEVYRK